MIIIILGGIGSGKSVTASKFMVTSEYNSFCNFKVNHPKVQRIKKEHIIKKTVKEVLKSGREVVEREINWEFWNEQKKEFRNFNIILDEVHNLVHSRQTMTRWNTLMSMWISQVRKILGDSEKTHILLISQHINRIDIAFRDLAHKIIVCTKYETGKFIKTKVLHDQKLRTVKLPVTLIIQFHFTGANCIQKLNLFNMGHKSYSFRTMYYANPFFKFYDSYELFGETDYL